MSSRGDYRIELVLYKHDLHDSSHRAISNATESNYYVRKAYSLNRDEPIEYLKEYINSKRSKNRLLGWNR
jgi:hypothetical protein